MHTRPHELTHAPHAHALAPPFPFSHTRPRTVTHTHSHPNTSDAPVAATTFEALAGGRYEAPCDTGTDEAAEKEALARSALTKKSVARACRMEEDVPVSYDRSQVWRVVKGKRIDAGAVVGKFARRRPPYYPPGEAASLRHDAPGLLSVRREGGGFDFSITLAAQPDMDTDSLVIGKVLKGMDVLQEISELPTVKAADIFGQGEGSSGGSRAKACYYGSTNSFCSQLKPLKKVVMRPSVVKSSS